MQLLDKSGEFGIVCGNVEINEISKLKKINKRRIILLPVLHLHQVL